MQTHQPTGSSPNHNDDGKLATLIRNGHRLALFAIICTALIAITDYYTRAVIARQAERQLQSTLSQMLPAGSYDNNLALSCVQLQNKQYLGDEKIHPLYIAKQGDRISGYVIESIAPAGYSGAIRLLTAVSVDGKVQRVQVMEHHETPGLGDKLDRKKSNWIDSFNQQSLQSADDKRWAVRKDGGMFDAFTGATITPRAVVSGVKQVLLLLREQPELLIHAKACPSPAA